MTAKHNHRAPLITAGIIFLLVAIGHLLRIIYHTQIMAGHLVIPMNISYVGLFLAFILSMWMFKASSKK